MTFDGEGLCFSQNLRNQTTQHTSNNAEVLSPSSAQTHISTHRSTHTDILSTLCSHLISTSLQSAVISRQWSLLQTQHTVYESHKFMVSALLMQYFCLMFRTVTEHYIYIPPTESPYFNQEHFFTPKRRSCCFQTRRSVLIAGGLNVQTGAEPDLTSFKGGSHRN